MIKHFYHALLYALAGLGSAWKGEKAFRAEVVAAVILIPTALYVTPDIIERALLIAVLTLVMIIELLNSAIEAAIDRIGEERHPLSKKAKDLGAAAVLMAIILAVIIWAGVIYSRIPYKVIYI